MESHELMIGNYLKCFDQLDDIIQVESISKEGVMHFVNEMWVEDLKPIPLTEQWLIDFGFQNLDWGYIIELDLDKTLRLVIHNGIYYPQIEQVSEASNEDVQVIFINSIEHVHHLQNLYFCLTGKQLNKKP